MWYRFSPVGKARSPVLHECLGQLYVARGTRDVDDSLHGAWLRVSDDYVT
jgi:hypothetical protein